MCCCGGLLMHGATEQVAAVPTTCYIVMPRLGRGIHAFFGARKKGVDPGTKCRDDELINGVGEVRQVAP
jgi:hypothetical protein